MDMEQIRKEGLMTKVRLYGRLWGNQQLQDAVCQAVADDDMATLVDVIDALVTKANEQNGLIAKQAKVIAALQATVDEVGKVLMDQQSCGKLITPPAKKGHLKTEEMWSLYQQYGSFNKVGKLLGCPGRTVSRRLHSEGYLV